MILKLIMEFNLIYFRISIILMINNMVININDIKEIVKEIRSVVKIVYGNNIPEQYSVINIVAKQGYLILTGATIETIIRKKIVVTNNKEFSGEAVLPIEELYKTVLAFTNDVNIEFKKKYVLFSQKKIKYKIFKLFDIPVVDYDKNISKQYEVDFNIKLALDKLKSFCFNKNIKKILTYVRFYNRNNEAWAVATNGHKIAGFKLSDTALPFEFLLNPQTPIDDIDKITIAQSSAFFVFISDSKIVYHRKFEENDYPDIDRIVDQKLNHYFEFDRNNIYYSMSIAKKLMGNDVMFSFEINDNIKITASNPEKVSASYEDTIAVIDKDIEVNASFSSIVFFDVVKLLDIKTIKMQHDTRFFIHKESDIFVGSMSLNITGG